MHGAAMWELWKVNCSGKIEEEHKVLSQSHWQVPLPPLYFPQYFLTWTQGQSEPRTSHQMWTERAPREALFFCFKEPKRTPWLKENAGNWFFFFFFVLSYPSPQAIPGEWQQQGLDWPFSFDQGNSGRKSMREVPVAFFFAPLLFYLDPLATQPQRHTHSWEVCSRAGNLKPQLF